MKSIFDDFKRLVSCWKLSQTWDCVFNVRTAEHIRISKLTKNLRIVLLAISVDLPNALTKENRTFVLKLRESLLIMIDK